MNKTEEELYFTTRLTESEHSIVKYLIEEECPKRNLELVYYRKFKEGHVPMYRECKIKGKKYKILEMLDSLKLEYDNANEKVLGPHGKKIQKWMLQ